MPRTTGEVYASGFSSFPASQRAGEPVQNEVPGLGVSPIFSKLSLFT